MSKEVMKTRQEWREVSQKKRARRYKAICSKVVDQEHYYYEQGNLWWHLILECERQLALFPDSDKKKMLENALNEANEIHETLDDETRFIWNNSYDLSVHSVEHRIVLDEMDRDDDLPQFADQGKYIKYVKKRIKQNRRTRRGNLKAIADKELDEMEKRIALNHDH